MNPSQDHQPKGLNSSLLIQPKQVYQVDPVTQDVLAEAWENIKVLVHSSLFKDLLHQWIEECPPPELNFSFKSILSSDEQSNTVYIPPQPQGPPLAPLSRPPSVLHSRRFFSSNTNTTSSSSVSSILLPMPAIHTEFATEFRHDDVFTTWKPAIHFPSIDAAFILTQEHPESNIFLEPSDSSTSCIRPCISSAISGSLGNASLWSVNTMRSSMSSQSGASVISKCLAPASTSGTPISETSKTKPSSGSKQNVYWCTFCETSFKRKYDWKRHEDEFHERWRKYPCSEPGCNRTFWGSNSFNRHHKQHHGCRSCPHAKEVVQYLRKRKYWACGFCSAFHSVREIHVEHIARHFESGFDKDDWMHSLVIHGLLHQPLVDMAWNVLVAEKHNLHDGRWPLISWSPSKTGRARGFPENESLGQLQDLLEFFSGDEAEARLIVSMAYDLSDIVMTIDDSMCSPALAPSQ